MNFRLLVQNVVEFIIIWLVWWALGKFIQTHVWSDTKMVLLIVCVSLMKAGYFGVENLQQLWQATRDNLPYHRYMLLMLMNMAQIAISYGLDYHGLYQVYHGSFAGLPLSLSMPEAVFEFIYYSILNFTFFGYGDVTPQTIPAKLMTISEIVLAFMTVIFLLSDFISLKESLIRSVRPAVEESKQQTQEGA
jgi:Ion channel